MRNTHKDGDSDEEQVEIEMNESTERSVNHH